MAPQSKHHCSASPPSVGFVLEAKIDEYLSASDLAALVGCRPNQRSMMARWLDRHGWRYAIDKNGVPQALRAYRDKKLGVSDGPQKANLAGAPNREAFAGMGENRSTTAAQARRQAPTIRRLARRASLRTRCTSTSRTFDPPQSLRSCKNARQMHTILPRTQTLRPLTGTTTDDA